VHRMHEEAPATAATVTGAEQQDRHRNPTRTKPVAVRNASDTSDNVNRCQYYPEDNFWRGTFYGLLFTAMILGGIVVACFLVTFLVSHAAIAAITFSVIILVVLVATRPEGKR
jgi:hypothetical protein